MKKIKQIIKKLLIFYLKTNGIILNNKINSNKIEKNDKSPNSVNIADEIPSEYKDNCKNKLINSDKKEKINNEYEFCEDNSYPI